METEAQRARRRMKELIEGDSAKREEARRRAAAHDSSWFSDLVSESLVEYPVDLTGRAIGELAGEVQSWFEGGTVELPSIDVDINLDL